MNRENNGNQISVNHEPVIRHFHGDECLNLPEIGLSQSDRQLLPSSEPNLLKRLVPWLNFSD